ncbi:alpha-L-fucosidase [Rapidithrix thailandica]|uniref:alpha-L-fucosidase n=1 Tax=Rapidithrix thailandica TaxID=413964 RepID=A0AAW9SGQ5_9BACT
MTLTRMKIGLFLSMFICLTSSMSFSQTEKYEANWESLDSRPVPGWFQDAKFGIFIHWGPYSVPAWSPKGTYSEWYQYWLQNKTLFGNGKFSGTEVYDYHTRTYGPHFSYYNFGEMFQAELFDANAWARLFEKSGAKYIAITSKHHDGFCLWPSQEASTNWGFPWNSMETGANRDLLGELKEAMDKTSVKFGLYYSLYEWFHPWYQKDFDRFVNEHFHPQFKDVVNRYQPHLIFADGEWEKTAEEWKSAELLAWLYNDSKAPKDVVINDRWGKGDRHKHGGYYTTEYESGLEGGHPWEECRGIGFSFGFNRNEDLEDYNSAQTLVLMLVDVVSRGGNLLLDIGPDGHGKIPVIMQERLLQIGEWLKVNGEAIYGTRTWDKPYQWSAGKKDYKPEGQHYLGGDFILKQTIDPEPGYAVKEMFFTQNEEAVFAILPRWPEKQLIIKDLKVKKDAKIQVLGTEMQLNWRQEKGNLLVEIPELSVLALPSEYAQALKITGVK